MSRKLIAECVGTFFLVLLACGSAVLAGPSIGVLGIGLCFGLVLLTLVYCIGNISGCHVNPAVSFGFWLSGRMSFSEMIGYWCAQFVGAAIAGGFLFWFVTMGDVTGFVFGGITPAYGNHGICDLATNVIQPGANMGMALVMECLFTFLFVMVVLGVSDEQHGFGHFAGLAIGLALGLVNIVGIPVDNCSVNPARSFGPALWCPEAWPDFWIMVVGPLVGAILAALCWKVLVGSRNPKSIE